MKKLFLLMIIMFLSVSVYAQGIGSGYGTKVLDFISPTEEIEHTGGEVCLDDGTGVLRKTNRPTWEIGFRANLLDTPNGGKSQVRTENLGIVLYHNLSNSLYAYVAYENRTTSKNHFEGQAFEDDWKNRHVFGGFGIYITPMLSVYAGGGKVFAEDDAGNKPTIDTAIEKGIALDFPMYGNKLRIEYRIVDAAQKGDVDVSESTGDAGFSTIAITFVVSL